MHNQGLKIKCARCLQQNLVGEMRYAKDGKTLVCQKCSLVTTPKTVTPPGVRKQYQCTACSYKFKRSTTPKLCPYCGKQKIVEKDEINASSLLKWE